MLATLVVIMVVLAWCFIGAGIYGASKWRGHTRAVQARLKSARVSVTPIRYDQGEIQGLPPPVRRYFGAVLRHGQPIVSGVHISQRGRLRLGKGKGKWFPFQAAQLVTTRPPGFHWNARVKMAPGVKVLVQDAYAGGEGILHAAVLGLITVAHLRGGPEMAQGELMRYLAEAPWYPTALLPGQGVMWQAIDHSRARATLTHGDMEVWVEFCFDREGLITAVRSPCRYRVVDGIFRPTPWEGRFRAYAERGGMLIPLEAEVQWHLPSGPFPYWTGRITQITYELAG